MRTSLIAVAVVAALAAAGCGGHHSARAARVRSAADSQSVYVFDDSPDDTIDSVGADICHLIAANPTEGLGLAIEAAQTTLNLGPEDAGVAASVLVAVYCPGTR